MVHNERFANFTTRYIVQQQFVKLIVTRQLCEYLHKNLAVLARIQYQYTFQDIIIRKLHKMCLIQDFRVKIVHHFVHLFSKHTNNTNKHHEIQFCIYFVFHINRLVQRNKSCFWLLDQKIEQIIITFFCLVCSKSLQMQYVYIRKTCLCKNSITVIILQYVQ